MTCRILLQQQLQLQQHRQQKLYRFFSAAGASPLIARTLYRHLLQWCRETDTAIPLQQTIPPMTLQAPTDVDPYPLEVLAAGLPESDPTIEFARQHLPPATAFTRTQMVVPIRNSSDIQSLVRSLFRLNKSQTKARIDLAFESLRNLHELSDRTLHEWQTARERHSVAAELRVGQVVQHQHERWRGVIVAWNRPSPADNNNNNNNNNNNTHKMKTSLTTKEYIATPPPEHQQSAASDTASETIQYDVLLDAGDAHSMGASSSSPSKASGVDLELIHDVHLTRIRNAQIPDYFDRFDTVLQRFVPSPVLQFQYPVDTTTSGVVATMNHHPRRAFLSPEMEDLCHEVVQGVQALAGQLERIILDETSCLTKDRNLTLLATIQARLQALSRGQLSSSSSSSRQQQQEKDGQFPLTRAAEHLHAWLLLQLELLDVCWQRHQVLEYSSVDDDDDDDDKQPPLYRIGQVVTHTHYNYRGIVVGWDPKPTVDVSRWDGLQHLSAEKVQEMPFYHVVPDPYDCMRVFGGERGLRYVCQENLAVCPPDQTDVEIEFEDEEWKREEVPGVGFRYRAPGQLLFKYAQEEGDAGKITERCMNQILKMINTWQYQACTDTVPPDSVASSLTMSNFMKLLQNADSLEDATPIQETIKEIRKAHRRLDLRWQLERGMTELMAGKGQRALEIFQDIVQDDPEYVEGWNKRATCEFMLGQYDASTVSTEKTLELDPNHFQSLNGLGLIHYQKDEYQEAVDCFRRSLELDPWSPVTSKLATCIDLLAHKVLSDELSN